MKGAHIRDCNDMKRTMIMVVLALMPAFLFGCWWTGSQVGLEGFQAFFYGLVRVLPMVCVSYIVGLAIEFYFAQVRGHEVNEGFLVTGLLIPMVFPVSTPLWMVGLSTALRRDLRQGGLRRYGHERLQARRCWPARLPSSPTPLRCRVRRCGIRTGR